MSTEAMYLNGGVILLENCNTVGAVMVNVAIARDCFATQVVVVDPASGQRMTVEEDIRVSKVQFVILNEEDAGVPHKCWGIDFFLHASVGDSVTCGKLLRRRRMLGKKKRAERTLNYVLTSKKGRWWEAAETLLRLGVDGSSALDHAAATGCLESVTLLVCGEVGCLSPATISNALIKASIHGHAEVAKILLSAHADVNCRGAGDIPVLILAVSHGCSALVQLLLFSTADVNAKKPNGATALIAACEGNAADIVSMLLVAQADVNARKDNGRTALIVASDGGQTAMGKMLLDAGANVNDVENIGRTALIAASYREHIDVVENLLAAAADVNRVGEGNTTALLVACDNVGGGVVKMLLAAKADVNARNHPSFEWYASEFHFDETTPLIKASSHDRSEVVNQLLAANAYVDGRGVRNTTALIAASCRACSSVPKLLVSAGADVNAAQHDGLTALIGACLYSDVEVVELLLAWGADANAMTHMDCLCFRAGTHCGSLTPLMAACCRGLVIVVKILLLAGADVNAKTGNGKTALKIASTKRQANIVDVLVAAGAVEETLSKRFAKDTFN